MANEKQVLPTTKLETTGPVVTAVLPTPTMAHPAPAVAPANTPESMLRSQEAATTQAQAMLPATISAREGYDASKHGQDNLKQWGE